MQDRPIQPPVGQNSMVMDSVYTICNLVRAWILQLNSERICHPDLIGHNTRLLFPNMSRGNAAPFLVCTGILVAIH